MLPPRPLLRLAGLVVAVVAGAAALGGVLGGPLGLVGVALGVLAGVPVSVLRTGTRLGAVVVAGSLVATLTGLPAAGQPVAAGLVVALAGVAQVPLTARAAGVGTMLPALPAVTATSALGALPPVDAAALAAWMLLGTGSVLALSRGLGIGAEPVPVPRRTALRHGVATAAAAGASAALVVALDVTHGFWMVLTVTAVLRAVPGETRVAARDRLAGTVVGLAVAVAVVVALPAPVALLAAVLGLVLVVAWAAAGDQRRATGYGAPLLVLVASSGATGPAVGVAAERLLLTSAGAGLAVVAALLLRGGDQPRSPAAGQEPASG